MVGVKRHTASTCALSTNTIHVVRSQHNASDIPPFRHLNCSCGRHLMGPWAG